jgi:hypothetical protein
MAAERAEQEPDALAQAGVPVVDPAVRAAIADGVRRLVDIVQALEPAATDDRLRRIVHHQQLMRVQETRELAEATAPATTCHHDDGPPGSQHGAGARVG